MLLFVRFFLEGIKKMKAERGLKGLIGTFHCMSCVMFVLLFKLFCINWTFLFLFVPIFEKAREFIVLYHFYVLLV